MEYGDPREVQELVMVAAECMGELTVGTESVEGTRKEDKKVTVSPSTTRPTVHTVPRCCRWAIPEYNDTNTSVAGWLV